MKENMGNLSFQCYRPKKKKRKILVIGPVPGQKESEIIFPPTLLRKKTFTYENIPYM
ncbi:Apocytochrome f [Platanthera zijinensis]|uniref:Apocytochrome f n=1 Tax=Platanthera zijinensis TaxID=2320716 RepID=A0AAP0G9W1_9ASPA